MLPQRAQSSWEQPLGMLRDYPGRRPFLELDFSTLGGFGQRFGQRPVHLCTSPVGNEVEPIARHDSRRTRLGLAASDSSPADGS
jgi:hypothetical protein